MIAEGRKDIFCSRCGMNLDEVRAEWQTEVRQAKDPEPPKA
jgi:hypothetical protein